jgi:hypothetical protein
LHRALLTSNSLFVQLMHTNYIKLLNQCTYRRFKCYGGICRHSTENFYNDTYTGTRNVILAKHWLWLPDDGLCKPKYVGAAFMILIVLTV